MNYCPTLREDFGWQIESDLIDVDHAKVNVQPTCSPEIICCRKLQNFKKRGLQIKGQVLVIKQVHCGC